MEGVSASVACHRCTPELRIVIQTEASRRYDGCCADPDCTGPTGPPSVNHDSTVIKVGTGRFNGATGGWSWSDSSTGGPLPIHAEGVMQLP